jgi:hypothetical protein
VSPTLSELWAFALMPACALLAVLGVFIAVTDDKATNERLLHTFMFFFIAILIAGIGVLRTPSVQRALNPALQAQFELEKNPLFQEIQRMAESSNSDAARFIEAEMIRGTPFDLAFDKARWLLEKAVVADLGFADYAARVQWARHHIGTLSELRTQDPALCIARMLRQPEGFEALHSTLSAQNKAAFREVFLIMQASARGYWDEAEKSKRAARYSSIDANAKAARYREIRESLEVRYSSEVMRAAGTYAVENISNLSPDEVCSAHVDLLSAILKEPEDFAGGMLDSLIR